MLPRPPADASLVVDLARIVGAHGVSTNDADSFAYARDCWPRDLMRIRSGEVPAAPSCVVWPETADEVARVLALAVQLDIPIIPFGAGSGVAGGARPSDGGITLDLKRMRAIRSFDEEDLRTEVECGVIGERLERMLNQRGYTLGHFPSSIICSTLGGWLAARSAGQQSTLYGKIEDMTFGMEVVTPQRIRRLMLGPRPIRGPDFNALVIGSEGTFGVITAAELRIRPLPEARQLRGFQFASVEAGLEAIRKILRAGIRPSVCRLYDALDTFIGRGHGDDDEEGAEAQSFEALTSRAKGVLDDIQKRVGGDRGSRRGLTGQLAKTLVRGTVKAVLGAPMLLNRAIEALPSDCLLILGFEGQRALVSAELAASVSVCMGEGARDLGAGPGEHWLKNRHNVSFKQSKAYASGVFTDTMEVASTWDRLLPMYKAVRRAISRDAFVMAHFSHAYPEGCSIYFTFAGVGPEPDDPSAALERYDRIWRHALAAVNEAGGTISHHHGIGILKAEAMDREHGPGGARMLSAMKYAFDPDGVMNPNKLGLRKPVPPRTRRSVAPSTRPAGLPDEIVAAVGEGNLTRTRGRSSVRPPDESALAAVLRVAHAREVPVATDQTGFRAAAGAVQIDLSRFDGVVRLSTHSLFVEVESGVIVERLERMLRRHGLTLGYVHPRANSRSVGAALARNMMIRRSVAHGDLRDLCFAVRGLLANGAPVDTRPVPRSATGPELDRALIGGAGRWGVITRATLRVAVVPPVTGAVAFSFADPEAAVSCARLVLRRGVLPSAARVLTTGVAAFELAAQDEAIMKSQRAIIGNVANGLDGTVTDPGDTAVGGRFDAVVEVAVPWTRAYETMSKVQAAAEGEAWLDFIAPEGATVVVRVMDRATRAAAVAAANECGCRVVAGTRTTHVDGVRVAGSKTNVPKQSPVSKRLDDDDDDWAPYDDVAQRVAATLDPAGVFRGRR